MILSNSGNRNLYLDLGKKNDDILGIWWNITRFLYLDFDNTEVARWNLGKISFLPISGFWNLHVTLGNNLRYYILLWFFP